MILVTVTVITPYPLCRGAEAAERSRHEHNQHFRRPAGAGEGPPHGEQQAGARPLLEDQLDRIRKVDQEINLAEAFAARAKDGRPDAVSGKLDAICRDLIEKEAQQRHEIETELRRLGDPVRASFLWLHYTQAMSTEEIAATLASTDDAAPDLKPTIERLIAEGVAAIDRLHR